MNCVEFIEKATDSLTGEKCVINFIEDEGGGVIHVDVSGQVASLMGKRAATLNAMCVIAKALGYNGKHRIKVLIHERT